MVKVVALTKTPQLVNIADLNFDPENFRLPEEAQGGGQNQLLEILDRDFDLIELGRSIADNGYFPEEPLVAIEHKPQLLVVEGNRRLAALKFLTFPALRKFSKDPSAWEDLARKARALPLKSLS